MTSTQARAIQREWEVVTPYVDKLYYLPSFLLLVGTKNITVKAENLFFFVY